MVEQRRIPAIELGERVGGPRAVCEWVFDVDGTLIDSQTGSSLRPGANELLSSIRDAGDRIVLWSAGGADYSRQRAVEHGIDGLFDGFVGKDRRDANGRYLPPPGDGLRVYVDDRPEDLPIGSTVVVVAPFISDNPFDRGLLRVADGLNEATFRPLGS